MKPKLDIATELMKVIQSLGLSSVEVKCLTLQWISQYPFLLEDFGWNIQIHARVQKIMTEINQLQALLAQAELVEESPAEDNEPHLQEDVETSAVDGVLTNSADDASPESDVVEPQETATESVLEIKSETQGEEEPSAETLEEEPKPEILESETPPLPRKGYSKYGKKLGRPPRQKVETPVAPAEAPLQPVVSAKSGAEETPPAPTVDESLLREERIAQLKYGKEYEYDLLYLVDNLYARSPFKLREEFGVKPVGVVVPYTHQDLKYEIVVYYADEHAVIPLNTANKYAKNKLLPYKNVSWRVKKATDDMHIRPALPVINEIFKKMGGDVFKGSYVDGRGQYYGHNVDATHKIRYVCEIPLSEQEEQSP